MGYLIERYTRMLASYGRELTPQTRILDFCCGAGEIVREFLEAGYNIRGFEPWGHYAGEPHSMIDTLGWQNPYSIENYRACVSPDLRSQWRAGLRLPYANAEFDFVFSQETMEHVPCHDTTICELRRVLRPGGIAIHTFPAKWRFIEPHIFVPLGGGIRLAMWYRLWFALRPRMPDPWPDEHLSTSDLARLAIWYGRMGLNYLPPRELRRIALRYFHISDFRPDLWEADTPKQPRSFAWYTRTKNVVWVTADRITT